MLHNRSMVSVFSKLNESELMRVASAETFETARPKGSWFWFDVLAPTQEEISQLGRRFQLDQASLAEVAGTVDYPKFDDLGSHVFAILHGLGEGSEGTLVELDVFVGSDFLITIHASPLPAVASTLAQAQRSPVGAEGGPDRMLARIAEAQARQFNPIVAVLEDRIESLEELAIQADPRVIGEVQVLRKDALRLRRLLNPQREALALLRGELSPLIGTRARRLFAQVYDQHSRLLESLDAARAMLSSVFETYESAAGHNLNEAIRVLTVFTAVLLPLTLVVGFYGMNVRNLPVAGRSWGVWAVLVGLVVLGIALWVYFARRRFIGAPRLRDLPRALGIGLFQLASLPVKTVADVFRGANEARGGGTDHRPR